MSGLDLSTQKSVAEIEDAGCAVHIRDVNDKPLYHGDANDKPVTITVAGQYSKTYRRADAQMRKRPIGRRGKITGETIRDDELSKIVACTLAWDGIFDGATPVQCNPANVLALYESLPWVLDQVMEGMQDHANFFRRDSAS